MSAPDRSVTSAVLESKAREGYYGKDSQTGSNADEKNPRIVLSEEYGKPTDETETRTSISPGPKGSGEKYAEEMQGCANRYVGKTVVVTGGSKGIGEGCVRVFFKAGANVMFCSRGDGQSLADELNGYAVGGQRACFVKADVSVVADLQKLIDETVKEFGQIDCLINNAGWHPAPAEIDDFTIENMQDLFQLNFISYFACCKFALPHIRKVQGNIINMSSWTGIYGQAQAPTYTATKGAITSFSKGLAIDEAKRNVRVNIVSPGNIWTPLWKAWSDGEADPAAARDAGDKVQMLYRKGTIIETGRLCLAIAADMTFTTGVDHIQSGGAELAYGVKG